MRNYTRIALINLALIAGIGLILRYKIAYSLPFIDQKHLLHGHSHFAFAGWVTHTLMLLLVNYLSKKGIAEANQKYRWLINANLITAYGMLISFPLQGYGLFSITFSTLSIIVSYIFAVQYWKDLNKITGTVAHWWIKASLIFNALSSLGAFSLAFMMANKIIHQNWYLAAVYFFLHFQYNGWFFFACMGLISSKLFLHIDVSRQKIIFWLFAAACIPAYVLSALWLPIPEWSYFVVVLAAVSQFAGWMILLKSMKGKLKPVLSSINQSGKVLLFLSSVALSIKLLLQLGSTIPALSKLAFGFRPIVIGYLHLILLGVISLFLIGYMIADNCIQINKKMQSAVMLLSMGVIVNELLLMIQGVAALSFTPVPYINEMLLVAAAFIFSSVFLLNLSQRHTKCVQS